MGILNLMYLGAKLVLDLELDNINERNNEFFVNVINFNDFQGNTNFSIKFKNYIYRNNIRIYLSKYNKRIKWGKY